MEGTKSGHSFFPASMRECHNEEKEYQMLIQLNIVDPDLISQGDKDVTIVMGLIQSDNQYPDYSLHSLLLKEKDGALNLSVEKTSFKTLGNRDPDGIEEIQQLSFHELLKRPLWYKLPYPHNVGIGGEIVVMRTDMPGQPDHLHSHVFVGFISGGVEKLKDMSGQLLQSNDIQSSKLFFETEMTPSGISLAHKTGNHLSIPLSYPAWGSSKELYGMRTCISKDLHKRYADAKKTILDPTSTDEQKKEAIRFNSFLKETEFVEYLRFTQNNRETKGFIDNQWWTEAQMKTVSKLTRRFHERNMSNEVDL